MSRALIGSRGGWRAAAISAVSIFVLLTPASADAVEPDQVDFQVFTRFLIGKLQYEAAPGRVDSRVSIVGATGPDGGLTVSSSRPLEVGEGCRLESVRKAFCDGRRVDTWINAELDAGSDQLVVEGVNASASLYGGRGADILEAASVSSNPLDGDSVEGGPGDDRLLIDGPGFVEGGPGDDRIQGKRGESALRGGPGDDRISGGPGPDLIVGDNGADTVAGNRGDDRIEGGRGADRLLGGAGPDLIFGNVGLDRVWGGLGWDQINLADQDRDRRSDCGPGRDEIRLDSRALDPRPRRCGEVSRPGR